MLNTITTPRQNIKTLTLDQLILAALILYVPIHLIEEALFGFPAWPELRWAIPIILFISVDILLGI